jgi:hypothetical protein
MLRALAVGKGTTSKDDLTGEVYVAFGATPPAPTPKLVVLATVE